MFTDADHAKAVELYQRYRHADWWPANTHWNDRDGAWQCNLDGKPYWSGNELEKDHALAVIAWAMVGHMHQFGHPVTLKPESGHWHACASRESNGHRIGWFANTTFLALAAAMEAQ